MKILYWTPLYWPDVGGIEVLASQKLPALRERGHEIMVVTSHGGLHLPDLSEVDGIPVHRFHFWKSLISQDLKSSIAIQRQVAALKASFQPDLIHLNFPGHIVYFHLKTLKACTAPTLLTVHTDFANARSGPETLLGQCLRGADWISSVSKATLDDVLEMVPEKARQSSVIYNGLKMPEITPQPLPFDPPHLLGVGRLTAEKGFDVAIEAFALLRDRFPAAHMSIAGDGPVRAELEALTEKLGLQDRIRFCGIVSREDLPHLFNSATAVVIPSRYREPFALVAVEAAQMERPVVATRWGGLQETVIGGRSGLLVENENPTDFAKAIGYLFDNPQIAREMGIFGRQRAVATFGLKNCVDQYEKLYFQLVSHPAQTASL